MVRFPTIIKSLFFHLHIAANHFLLFHSHREDSDVIPTENEVIIFINFTYDGVSLILPYIYNTFKYSVAIICK